MSLLLTPKSSGQPSSALEKVKFPAGSVIFEQGHPGDAAYILDSGRVTMLMRIDGRDVELDPIRPGDIFGEMAAFDSGPRMATAVAAEDCLVSRIPRHFFERKLEEADKFLRKLLVLFIKNIRSSSRIFVRRPRSLRDSVTLMKSFSANIKRFNAAMEAGDEAQALARATARLDEALKELSEVSLRVKDKRHNHILEEDDTSGVAVAAMFGSGVRRPG